MRILAADGDSTLLLTMNRHLKSWGYEPVLAESGVDAWRILNREDAPPVAILDWDMPDLAGLEVCRMLRSTPHGKGVYVIVTATRGTKSDLVDALEGGADDYVAKPLHAHELRLRIAKAITFREGRPRARLGSIPPASAPPSSFLPASGPPSSVLPASAPPPSSLLSSGPQSSLRPSSIPPSSLRPSSVPPPSGSLVTLGGRYRLERKIAEGSIANVWLGVHLSLGINVAVKFMKAQYAERVDYASFERDARAAAQLRSEHIVRVYGHGSHEGVPYLVMEYLGGEVLGERLARRGPMSISESVVLVEQLARALADAHARMIVHRDVRPENVILLDEPERAHGFRVKLIDFGFLQSALTQSWPDAPSPPLPAFVSPECVRGDAQPDAMLDLWGLGATAFAALTGRRPFEAETLPKLLGRICSEPLPLPSSLAPVVPPSFDAWFARACARDRDARFQSASDLAAALTSAWCEYEATRSPGPR